MFPAFGLYYVYRSYTASHRTGYDLGDLDLDRDLPNV